jgi:hypothetical protein
MKIERSQFFAVTSILDRNGKRVGNYLVDRSKDSLNKEQKEQPKAPEDEAVVFHSAEPEAPADKHLDVEVKTLNGISSLNITA